MQAVMTIDIPDISLGEYSDQDLIDWLMDKMPIMPEWSWNVEIKHPSEVCFCCNLRIELKGCPCCGGERHRPGFRI